MNKNKIHLKYEILPISVNKAYMTRFGYRVLSEQARKFKQDIITETIKQVKNEELDKLYTWEKTKVTITIVSETWFTKSNKIRKKDIASFEKLLTDAIFEALKIDDSCIFNLILIKEVGLAQIIYTIEEIK